MQLLVATGIARLHPAFSPTAVIPPAFGAPFVDCVPAPPATDADVEMPDA
jgi:hypothetical protein